MPAGSESAFSATIVANVDRAILRGRKGCVDTRDRQQIGVGRACHTFDRLLVLMLMLLVCYRL